MFVPHSDSQRVLVTHPCASNFPQGLDFIQRTCDKKRSGFLLLCLVESMFRSSYPVRDRIFSSKGGAAREGHRPTPFQEDV